LRSVSFVCHRVVLVVTKLPTLPQFWNLREGEQAHG
jgi:hypothetical protein